MERFFFRSPRSPRSPGGSAIPDILKSVQIKRCLKSIARSQSMKERTGSDVAVMFRSRSLKEKSKNVKQNDVDGLTDEFSEVNLSRNGPFHRQRAVRARHPPKMRDLHKALEHVEGSMNTLEKDSEDGASSSCLADVSSSSILQRRRSNIKKL